MNLRISTTTIDAFHNTIFGSCYRCDGFGTVIQNEETAICPSCNGDGKPSEQEFLERLKNPKYEKTKYMELGTAFHECLEKSHECYDRHAKAFNGSCHGFLTSDGIEFPYKVITSCLEHVDIDGFPFEVKMSKDYQVDDYLVTVVAKVDQIKGLWINEHKSVWTQYKYEKYEDSIQKNFYMEIFNSPKIRYKVFVLYSGAKGIKLNNIHIFDFDRQEGLEQENLLLLRQFVDYIKHHKLEQYLINEKRQSDVLSNFLD